MEEYFKDITSLSFYNDFLCDFKKHRMLHPKVHAKNLDLDTSSSRTSTFHKNYMTLLTKDCPEPQHFKKALDTINEVLEEHSQNFIALCHKIEMSLKMGDFAQAKQTIAQARIVLNNKSEIILAKTEIAAMYIHFGPAYYKHAVELYEEALREMSLLSSEEQHEPYFHYTMLRVRISLAQTYNKLMARSMLQIYWPDTELNNAIMYSRITRQLMDVIESEPLIIEDEAECIELDFPAYKGWAWAELGYASSKYAFLSFNDETIGEVLAPETCFQKAMEIAPETSFILEKYGQYKRQNAKTITEYEDAVALLKKAIELEPNRYLAIYQLGVAYRSMWLLEEDQKKLSWKPLNRKTNRQLVVKPPKSLIDQKLIPIPSNDLKFYEIWRNSNPVPKNVDNMYFSNSQHYFKLASEMVHNSCCLYLVDLARSYISCKNFREAENCFQCAENGEYDPKAATHLFVQRALMYQNLGNQSCTTESTNWNIKMAIHLYREAIIHFVPGSTSPDFAFLNLLQLLYGETQREINKNNLALQREYFLLYMMVQDAQTPKELILELTRDESKVNTMWKLIEMFHERDELDDNAAAFMYISILARADKLKYAVTQNTSTANTEKLILDISKISAQTCAYPENTIAKTYQWLNFLRNSSQKYEVPMYLLAPETDNPVAMKVLQILTICNIPVHQLFLEDYTESENLFMNTRENSIIVVENVEWDYRKLPPNSVKASFDSSTNCSSVHHYSVWTIPEHEICEKQAIHCGFQLLEALFFAKSNQFGVSKCIAGQSKCKSLLYERKNGIAHSKNCKTCNKINHGRK